MYTVGEERISECQRAGGAGVSRGPGELGWCGGELRPAKHCMAGGLDRVPGRQENALGKLRAARALHGGVRLGPGAGLA